MNRFIPLSVPNINGNEIKYVTKALETEWVSTAGAYITEFEDKLSDYVKSKYAVACQSGTAGLHLALIACDVKTGDEVIVPTLTFIAAVNPVRYIGAEPVFMDCDDSLTMDTAKLECFIENECIYDNNRLINKVTGRHVKAIIIVHVFGNISDMEKIIELSKMYNLKIIEDATEALGSYIKEEKHAGKYAGKYAGTIGDIGVYSFNGNKIITTGGGGMLVSDNEDLICKCRHLSTQAKTDPLYFDHDEVGFNYRMTNVQAALGIAQLEQLEEFIKIKGNNFKKYIEDGIELLKFKEDIRPNYWFYSYLTHDRDRLIKYLGNNMIQSRPVWKLIHTLAPYKYAQAFRIEKAVYYYEKIVNIPCSTNLLIEDIDYISNIILNFSKEGG